MKSERLNVLRSSVLSTILIGVCVCIVPTVAWSADFTFNIPYDVKNIGSTAKALSIDCVVREGGQRQVTPTGPGLNGGNVIGQGQKTMNIPSGKSTMKGTARVEVNASAGKDPERANKFRCGLRFQWKTGGSSALQTHSGRGNILPYYVDTTKPNNIAVADLIAKYRTSTKLGVRKDAAARMRARTTSRRRGR